MMAGRDLLQGRHLARADLGRVLAALGEAAAGRRLEQARHRAGDRLQPLLLVGAIDARDRVYAATSPDGKVYRMETGGKSSVFYDPKQMPR